MISVLVVIFHILASLALILVVLLQVGKGQSIGAAFGGAGSSSQTLFGSRGPATFLSHLTTAAAAVFMITSLSLAYLSSHARERSVITDQAPPPPGTSLPLQPTPPIDTPAVPPAESPATPAAPPAPESSPVPAPTTEQRQ